MMPYWEHIMKLFQTKILAFSCLVPCYNQVKNRRFLEKIQDGNQGNNVVQQKLGNKGAWNFWRLPEVTRHYKKIPPLQLYISRNNWQTMLGNLSISQFQFIFLFPSFWGKARKIAILDFLHLQYKLEITP